MVGDAFLGEIADELYKLRRTAIDKHKEQPYLFQTYNVKTFMPESSTGINRILTAFITALNENHHLPKLVLVVPDADILLNMPKRMMTSSMFIGALLHYIIKQMDVAIERRLNDLHQKRPGSIQTTWKTKFIWVRMLKHPVQSLDDNLEKVFSLRGKFNSILEERLLDGDADNHHIISIDVPVSGYDLTSKITLTGAHDFWLEMNKGIKRFDYDDILLKPRLFGGAKKKAEPARKVKSLVTHHFNTGDVKRKLPTPPSPTPVPKRGHYVSPDCRLSHHSHKHRHPKAKHQLYYDSDGSPHMCYKKSSRS